MAPAVRVAIGEAFGFEPGTNVEKKIASGLRKLGVDYVFDTTWAADLTIMEEATEFQDRLEKHLAGYARCSIISKITYANICNCCKRLMGKR